MTTEAVRCPQLQTELQTERKQVQVLAQALDEVPSLLAQSPHTTFFRSVFCSPCLTAAALSHTRPWSSPRPRRSWGRRWDPEAAPPSHTGSRGLACGESSRGVVHVHLGGGQVAAVVALFLIVSLRTQEVQPVGRSLPSSAPTASSDCLGGARTRGRSSSGAIHRRHSPRPCPAVSEDRGRTRCDAHGRPQQTQQRAHSERDAHVLARDQVCDCGDPHSCHSRQPESNLHWCPTALHGCPTAVRTPPTGIDRVPVLCS